MFGMGQGQGEEAGRVGLPFWTGRRLDQVDTAPLLDRIGALHEEIARVRRQLTRETIPEVRLGALASALDHATLLITGEERGSARGRVPAPALARRFG